MEEADRQEFRQRVWQLIHHIPSGKVATYGQIAALADHPTHARLVGKILSRLPNGSALPWHRVVNASGRLTSPASSLQRHLLASEGVVLMNGRINLKIYRWVISGPYD